MLCGAMLRGEPCAFRSAADDTELTGTSEHMQAIATAQAVALAQISAGCVIVGDASVCAFAEADIKATSTVRSRISALWLPAAGALLCVQPD